MTATASLRTDRAARAKLLGYSDAAGAAFFFGVRFAAVVVGFFTVRSFAARAFFFTCALRRFIFCELRRSNFPMRGN